jgi:hypothetical protein
MRMRAFAQRLIACERAGEKASAKTVPTALVICTKLQPDLASLMGDSGFRAVMSRALTLAKLESPQLLNLRITTNDERADLYEYEPGLVPDEIADGGVVLLAQLLGLLGTFIGDSLTERIVRGVWPKLPLSDWNEDNGANHE